MRYFALVVGLILLFIGVAAFAATVGGIVDTAWIADKFDIEYGAADTALSAVKGVGAGLMAVGIVICLLAAIRIAGYSGSGKEATGSRRGERKTATSSWEKQLEAAFLRKEETQDFLSNLERLKEDSSVSEEQYELLRSEYQRTLASIESEIAAIKNDLNKELVNHKRDLGAYKVEVERLGIKHKVGEIPLERYRSLDQKLMREIEEIEGKISQLEALINANSSVDISVVAERL